MKSIDVASDMTVATPSRRQPLLHKQNPQPACESRMGVILLSQYNVGRNTKVVVYVSCNIKIDSATTMENVT